jgi:hypothetical protein
MSRWSGAGKLRPRARPDREDRARNRLPVIVLLNARDPEFVSEASKRGVFAHIGDADVQDWQSLIEIVLRRFAGQIDAAVAAELDVHLILDNYTTHKTKVVQP